MSGAKRTATGSSCTERRYQHGGEETVDPGDAEAEQLDDFSRCIRDGGSPETGGKEGLEVVTVLEAIIDISRFHH